MGTMFKIILYAPDQAVAEEAADSAFARIDELNTILSDYIETSELNRLAKTSGTDTSVAVSDELFYVISEAQAVSQKTGGAFDITIGPYVQLWREMNRQSEYGDIQLPDPSTLEKASQSVGFQHIKIDTIEKRIALTQPGTELDLGGIAKGYTTDEALKVLQSFGIQSALVDAGGDITLGEPPPGKSGWQVSVPYHASEEKMDYLSFTLFNRAIATSGDLFQFVEIDGERYSHIINPHTGLGLTNQSMVTVIAPDGITADSYASALSVLGPERGMELLESIPGIMARFEFRENETFEVLESPGFEKWYTNH
jgi:thiamine biosynthesis lipoprotein